MIGTAHVQGTGIMHTNQYINILCYPYRVTVTYANVQVGCQCFTFDQLDEDFTRDDCGVEWIKTQVELSLAKILNDTEERNDKSGVL